MSACNLTSFGGVHRETWRRQLCPFANSQISMQALDARRSKELSMQALTLLLLALGAVLVAALVARSMA